MQKQLVFLRFEFYLKNGNDLNNLILYEIIFLNIFFVKLYLKKFSLKEQKTQKIL